MDGRFDLHHDGLLPPDQAERLARDPGFARELATQRALDAALRRRFQAPSGLAAPEPAASGARRGSRAPLWIAAAAAAALAALAAGLARLGGERADPPAEVEIARLSPADDPAPSAPAPPAARPDLESLARRVFGSVGPWIAAAGKVPEDLGASLGARYEACVDVDAGGCRLYGPYAAPEWPSATVLVGICETGDPRPALLVVDDQTLVGCAYPPETGALSPFYKEVGGLAVWEVSADGEPRLLDAVRACPQ